MGFHPRLGVYRKKEPVYFYPVATSIALSAGIKLAAEYNTRREKTHGARNFRRDYCKRTASSFLSCSRELPRTSPQSQYHVRAVLRGYVQHGNNVS